MFGGHSGFTRESERLLKAHLPRAACADGLYLDKSHADFWQLGPVQQIGVKFRAAESE